MNSPVPRIAIPEPTSTDTAYNQRSLPQYIRAVEAAGGIAVPISLYESPASLASQLASCSAILLPGSPADIDPARYGQEAVKACSAKDAAREAADDALLRDAFAQAKPILGICYGLQSLNVYRAGTLVQHIESVINHSPGRGVANAHSVDVAPGSKLAGILGASAGGGKTLPVNSSHHQSADAVGDGLRVVARSVEDGVIEAVEGTAPGHFLLAVQWHPERSVRDEPRLAEPARAIFRAFIEAARERARVQPG